MCSGDAIPPDSTLVFEVELVHTADGPVPPNVFKQIDVDKDQQLTHEEVWRHNYAGDLRHHVSLHSVRKYTIYSEVCF